MSRTLLSLVFLAAVGAFAGCVPAADRGEQSPGHRALPAATSGHETDSPTSSRTGAQRPVETDSGDSGDDSEVEP